MKIEGFQIIIPLSSFELSEISSGTKGCLARILEKAIRITPDEFLPTHPIRKGQMAKELERIFEEEDIWRLLDNSGYVELNIDPIVVCEEE